MVNDPVIMEKCPPWRKRRRAADLLGYPTISSTMKRERGATATATVASASALGVLCVGATIGISLLSSSVSIKASTCFFRSRTLLAGINAYSIITDSYGNTQECGGWDSGFWEVSPALLSQTFGTFGTHCLPDDASAAEACAAECDGNSLCKSFMIHDNLGYHSCQRRQNEDPIAPTHGCVLFSESASQPPEGTDYVQYYTTGTRYKCYTSNHHPTPITRGPANTNLVRYGTAHQSSTCHDGAASRALNGDVKPLFSKQSISHTCQGFEEWWQADFDTLGLVGYVVIYNRMDEGKTHQLAYSKVELLDDDTRDGTGDLEVVASRDIPKTDGIERLKIDFDGIKAKAVRITKLNPKGVPQSLAVAEVAVLGQAGCWDPTTTCADGTDLQFLPLRNNLVRRYAQASQSTTCHRGSAYRAVDTKSSGFWRDKTISHTCNGFDEYWQALFPVPGIVDYVDIYNRLDDGTSVFLSDTIVQLLDYSAGQLVVVDYNSEIQDSTNTDRYHLTFNHVRAAGIRIRKRQGAQGAIILAEVVVQGTAYPKNSLPHVNPLIDLAKGGIATQSSTCNDAVASRAIDGNESPYVKDQGIAMTCKEQGAWFMVEFAMAGHVNFVDIINRMDDGLSSMLSFSVVELLDYVTEEDRKAGKLTVVYTNKKGILDTTGIELVRARMLGKRASAVRISRRAHENRILNIPEIKVMGVTKGIWM